MPYDIQAEPQISERCLRDEILDLMSRKSLDPNMSEQQYRAALKAIVTCSRSPADELWDNYHARFADTRASTYACYGY